MTTMKAVMLTRKGGPEVLEVVELPLPEPQAGEVRVKVLVTGVGATDITMRRGTYPYAPKLPFVPGYESVGLVDAVVPDDLDDAEVVSLILNYVTAFQMIHREAKLAPGQWATTWCAASGPRPSKVARRRSTRAFTRYALEGWTRPSMASAVRTPASASRRPAAAASPCGTASAERRR